MHTDREEDPHSPIVKGFWYAHNGWYIQTSNPLYCFLYAIAGPIRMLIDAWNRPQTNQEYNALAKDIACDNFYQFVSQASVFRLLVCLHVLIPFGLSFYFWAWTGVWALWVTLIAIYNLGDVVNSIGHEENEFKAESDHHSAKNSHWLALLTFGDGYHADHHSHPSIAKLGLTKPSLDLAWLVIRLLMFLNIAYEVRTLNTKDYRLD